eukprot:TRINITY_DN15779_c0_g1_i2.p1 TRINITY_DN15779_c0_g1~~TRINITY_DN15779_c0_g1_i2.p1  ORF type:complete len:116 (+),score=31.82 TRINITY_DN15779_c0_g1_i2:49-396(+)
MGASLCGTVSSDDERARLLEEDYRRRQLLAHFDQAWRGQQVTDMYGIYFKQPVVGVVEEQDDTRVVVLWGAAASGDPAKRLSCDPLFLQRVQYLTAGGAPVREVPVQRGADVWSM